MLTTGFFPVPVKYSVTTPISTPAISPITVAKKMFNEVIVYVSPNNLSLYTHSLGSIKSIIKYIAPIIINEEPNSPMFNAF